MGGNKNRRIFDVSIGGDGGAGQFREARRPSAGSAAMIAFLLLLPAAPKTLDGYYVRRQGSNPRQRVDLPLPAVAEQTPSFDLTRSSSAPAQSNSQALHDLLGTGPPPSGTIASADALLFHARSGGDSGQSLLSAVRSQRHGEEEPTRKEPRIAADLLRSASVPAPRASLHAAPGEALLRAAPTMAHMCPGGSLLLDAASSISPAPANLLPGGSLLLAAASSFSPTPAHVCPGES